MEKLNKDGVIEALKSDIRQMNSDATKEMILLNDAIEALEAQLKAAVEALKAVSEELSRWNLTEGEPEATRVLKLAAKALATIKERGK